MAVLFLLVGTACGGGGASDARSCVASASTTTCLDSSDCDHGQVCCVLPGEDSSTATECTALADCLACEAVVACRTDEMTCQSLDLGACFADANPPGNHCAKD